ncbi:MAG TPA: Gfo/Idh/MocA family oxidoreductase [Pirellulales bacterium]|nr:Gfo/Idh/MocA family oxidoreductase [Pirellulales bacterium]
MSDGKRRLKAAVFGAGPHGQRIVSVLAEMPEIELVAVVDHHAKALAAGSIPAGVARLESGDALMAGGGADLVCIATNGPSHASLALAAMAGGARYVMIEKPMACSLGECNAIVTRARETGSRITVDHARCYAPPYLWLREQIASGRWGTLKTIWMQRPGIGLGCNAVHSFAAIAMLAGAPVERVTAWVDPPVGRNPRGAHYVDPGGLVVLELAGGVRGVVAQIEDGAGPMSADIHLTAGRVRLDERFGTIEIVERDLSVKPGPNRPAVMDKVEPPAGLSAHTAMSTMVRGCLEHLISDRGGADGLDGRASIEVLVAAYESHDRGNQPVSLPLTSQEAIDRWLPVT